MKGLIDLKPYLVTRYSLERVRVVVEVVLGKNHKQCLKGLTSIIDYLAEQDAKIPVMIYFQSK